jgi:hypothetical protein
MNIFISSLISGMAIERQVVQDAIDALGHRPVTAESFGAKPSSPQVACLSALRQSDAVVLILGPRYGAVQPSGLSATHEEFREAQATRRPVFVFVAPGDPEPQQADFVREVGPWVGGQFYESYTDATDLGRKVTRALHRYELAQASSPVNPQALVARAQSLLPRQERNDTESRLVVAIAAGPDQAVLRPAQLDARELLDAVGQRLLFSSNGLFPRERGIRHRITGTSLHFEQDTRRGEGSRLSLHTNGDLVLDIAMHRDGSAHAGFPMLIEEDVQHLLAECVATAVWCLDHIDPTQRLSHLALAAQVQGGAAMGWRTRQQHLASPNSFQGGHLFGHDETRDAPVTLPQPHFPRQALAVHSQQFVEDLVALFSRRWKGD